MTTLWIAISLWSAHKHFSQRYFTDFLDIILQESEERVELHEKRLVITFWRRQVRKSVIDHFVAMIMHLSSLCRNKCQLLDFIKNFQRTFKKSEEKVELHQKRLLKTFWRRHVRKSMIAHFVAVIMYLLNLCRN